MQAHTAQRTYTHIYWSACVRACMRKNDACAHPVHAPHACLCVACLHGRMHACHPARRHEGEERKREDTRRPTHRQRGQIRRQRPQSSQSYGGRCGWRGCMRPRRQCPAAPRHCPGPCRQCSCRSTCWRECCRSSVPPPHPRACAQARTQNTHTHHRPASMSASVRSRAGATGGSRARAPSARAPGTQLRERTPWTCMP
jgi:hypothetical protein